MTPFKYLEQVLAKKKGNYKKAEDYINLE